MSNSVLLLLSFAIQCLIQFMFKTIGDKHIELIKVMTGVISNEEKKFMEKEYLSMIECWSLFMESHRSLCASLCTLYRHYPIDNMDDSTLDIFLRAYGCSELDIHVIKKSTEKSKKFFEIDKNNNLNKSKELIRSF